MDSTEDFLTFKAKEVTVAPPLAKNFTTRMSVPMRRHLETIALEYSTDVSTLIRWAIYTWLKEKKEVDPWF